MIKRIPMTHKHRYFFDLCMLNAKQSKDPSTQVGSVLRNDRNVVVGMGWNGFPRGCCDHNELYKNREVKYQRTVHAEINAVLNSNASTQGCSMYSWPLPPCERCAPVVIQAGIKEIFVLSEATKRHDWLGSGALAMGMFEEVGIKVYEVYDETV